jgi:hypothetical protein
VRIKIYQYILRTFCVSQIAVSKLKLLSVIVLLCILTFAQLMVSPSPVNAQTFPSTLVERQSNTMIINNLTTSSQDILHTKQIPSEGSFLIIGSHSSRFLLGRSDIVNLIDLPRHDSSSILYSRYSNGGKLGVMNFIHLVMA